MFRLGRLTDYGIVVMSYMAADPERLYTAAEVAVATRLRQPTVSKLLRQLARGGLLDSQRGVKGGYSLARPPAEISVAGVIRAIEGPIALTACTEGDGGCEHEPGCPVRAPWQQINVAVLGALEQVRLVDMMVPPATGGRPGDLVGALARATTG